MSPSRENENKMDSQCTGWGDEDFSLEKYRTIKVEMIEKKEKKKGQRVKSAKINSNISRGRKVNSPLVPCSFNQIINNIILQQA